jgi:hypothetical protein
MRERDESAKGNNRWQGVKVQTESFPFVFQRDFSISVFTVRNICYRKYAAYWTELCDMQFTFGSYAPVIATPAELSITGCNPRKDLSYNSR